MDGPSVEVRRLAAIRRSAGVRQRRYLVTRHLLSLTSREDIEAHYLRLDGLIREGCGKDAIQAFKCLYSFIAVPPGEDTRVLAEAVKRGDVPLPATPREVVIVMPSPPERTPPS